MNRRVVIVQEHLPAFRVPFYRQLKTLLEQQSVGLELVYAPNQRNTFLKGELEWATPVPIRWLGPLGWQPVTGLVRGCDLVVVQQETKYAANPVLQALAAFGGPPVAYWGHGRNFQAPPGRSYVKDFLSTRVHWWFAYNSLSARVVEDIGYPRERITSVGNAVDTTAMIGRMKSLVAAGLDETRRELDLHSENVAVFTGGLYPNKRPEFLIQAAGEIRRRIPDFELLIIGGGPSRGLVTQAAAKHRWIHDLGPKDELGKVPYWALSKVLMMPGLVGLVVVDSFALGVPLVTTDFPFHSPEIDYLRSGVNGLVVPCGESAEVYAEAVAELLCDPARLGQLREGAVASAAEHTIENMAASFADGILKALAAPVR